MTTKPTAAPAAKKFTPHAEAEKTPIPPSPDGVEPTQDDQDEAEGLALTILSMLDGPHIEELFDTLDSAVSAQQQPDDSPATPPAGKRAFAAAAAPRPGMQLVASRKNPRVRRWIKFAAVKHVAKNAGQHLGSAMETSGEANSGVGLISAANHAADRLMSLRHEKRTARFTDNAQDATHPQHYLTHHADLVGEMSKRYGISTGTVAHALAYHGTAELERQKKNADYSAKGNKTNPYHNPNTSDTDYHKHLGNRAKSNFITSMIRIRKK